jgi:hypothetical protein
VKQPSGGAVVTLALAWALAAACAAPAPPIQYVYDGGAAATADGLYRVQTDRVGAAFLKPGASFHAYDAVMIDPVTVSYTRPATDGRRRDDVRGSYPLGYEHTQRLKRILQEAVESELTRGEAFAVVTTPGPGVLRISGHIVDLVWEQPPWRGGEDRFVLRTGKMTLILDVRDAQTGEPLARLADRRPIQPGAEHPTGAFESNPVNNWGGVRDLAASWARILREALATLRELNEVPLPPNSAPRPL